MKYVHVLGKINLGNAAFGSKVWVKLDSFVFRGIAITQLLNFLLVPFNSAKGMVKLPSSRLTEIEH